MLLLCLRPRLLLQDMLELISSNLRVCEKEVAKLQAAAPRIVTTQQRLLDMTLLAAAGTWVYYVLGTEGQRLTWGGDDSRVLLPFGFGGYTGIEAALAVMALAIAVSRVVWVQIH